MPSLSRRGFFGLLGGAAALALDPEKALWVPGKKLISIPRFGGGQLQEFVVTGIDFSMEEFRQIYLRPALEQIANNIDESLERNVGALIMVGRSRPQAFKKGDRFTIAGVYA